MVQKTWERRNEYQVIESMKYFLEAIPRIMEPGYVATPQDILHIRIRSSGKLQGLRSVMESRRDAFMAGKVVFVYTEAIMLH